ncbi:G-D-S-L family lipolytic protein [Lacinutrix sp. MedPE-SW]|uniref:SGNH/GDSL hydrolase family protein n=1 Tax=Lacinutrix sp. MedPE-SW TaxID=1860087 RepID=UPI000922A128|nr:G-D-S-L family lipolytic protein [Lacinutrix sp. MedPE-SW]OIQ23348.1 MAG: G-D-S-L family lipolytic protein [Lacinutrix sp. MedPE-SW]
MKNIKYIWLLAIALGFTACNDEEDFEDRLDNPPQDAVVLPALTAGSADFSNFVSLGASFTAGFSDNALFISSQENSFPNTMAKQFAKAGGGSFTQPLMNDNFGGLAVGGTRITEPRLVFGGAGPVPLESVIGPVTVSTDLLSPPNGPFNNVGVPGAKSFHMIAPGYGNLANFPSAANPYAVRLTGATPDASMLELAVAQNPTFFTLSEVGGNDVLGYAISGGDGSDVITPTATFDFSLNTMVTALTANGAKGAIGNVPNITSLSYFTTVPYNALEPSNPDFGPQIPTLNTIFGALNPIFNAVDPSRAIVFSETEASPVIIKDENLADISAIITQALNDSDTFPAFLAQFGLPPQAAPLVASLLGNTYGQSRQATAEDLLVLPSSSIIGTVNATNAQFLINQGLPANLAGQFSAEGVSFPLEDKWVLTPEEQQEVADATAAYNATISSVATANGLALVDLNSILEQASTVGIQFDDYNLNTSLVFGGLVSLDGVHLTARGYALMANSFLEAIDTTYGSNFVASGNVAKAEDFSVTYSPLLQ